MASDAERAARLREAIQLDPVGFVTNVLGFPAWSAQRSILESVRDNPRTAVRSCHGTGKTAIAARVVLWFLAAYANSRVVTTAPIFDQVRYLLWPEIHVGVSKAPPGLYPTPLDTRLEISKDWFAVGLTSREPENFAGHHAPHLLFVGDEASGIPEPVYVAAEGFQTAEGGRVLLIGNPTQTSGLFYRAFHGERAAWHQIHISAFDSPNFTGEEVADETARALVSRAWADEKAAQWGVDSPMYQIRVLGEFPKKSEDQVIDLALVEAAHAREVAPTTPAVVSCDVARFGSDETVIAVRTGKRCRIARTYTGKDLMHTCGVILEVVRELREQGVQPHIVVDDAGLGGGVVDRLREQGYAAEAFNAGARACDPSLYTNRRSEAWFAFAEALPGLDLDDDPQLAADLVAPRYKLDSASRRVVESKDVTKRRLGRSPDRADAVLMAYAPAPSIGASFVDVDLWAEA